MFKITNLRHIDDGDDNIYLEIKLGDAIWSAIMFVIIGIVLARVLG